MRISDWSSDVCSSDLQRCAQVAGIVGSGFEAVETRRLDIAKQALRRRDDPARTHPQRAIAAFGVEALDVAPRLVAQDQRGRVVHGNRRILGRRLEDTPSELPSLMRNTYYVRCLKKKKQTTHT